MWYFSSINRYRYYMFFALLSTIITSFSEVFWKRSLNYKIWTYSHSLVSFPIGIILAVYLIFFWWYDIFSTWFFAIISIFLILLIDIIKEPFEQQLYREEKISVLAPYLNLNKIFVIIASFFIFQDVSLLSFFIILFTVLIIIFFSINIKQRKFPRNFWKILIIEIMKAIVVIFGGWVILNYWELSYFVNYIILGFSWYLLLSIYFKQLSDIQKLPIVFWKDRTIWWLWWVSWFIWLIVIKNLWLSVSILLGFLWIWITLLVSYIFTKDIPARKDILLSIFVSIFVFIGYYLK